MALALLGWAIAEGKDKVFSYHNNDEEQESLNRTHEMQKQNDYAELDINDVIRTISTKGFSA